MHIKFKHPSLHSICILRSLGHCELACCPEMQLSAASKLLVVWGLCKLHALVDVALKDRHQVVNTLLLNGVQLAQVTHLLNTPSTQLDLHSMYCTDQSRGLVA